MTTQLPRYIVTLVPSDLNEPGPLMRRWFMQDEPFLRAQLANINAVLAGYPWFGSGLSQEEAENRRWRLTRARDKSIIPALDTIASRSGLTWADLHDLHQQHNEDLRRWLRSGAATLCYDFAFDFAGEQRFLMLPVPIGYEDCAREADVVWLDKLSHEPLQPLSIHDPNNPRMDYWLQTMPSGGGTRINAWAPYIGPAILAQYPDCGLDLLTGWQTKTEADPPMPVSSVIVGAVNGHGFYATFPRVRDMTMHSLAVYGMEAHFRGLLLGVPDQFHVQFGEQGSRGIGESHESVLHGVANCSCHVDITNKEADAWGTTQEQTGPFNTSPFAGSFTPDIRAWKALSDAERARDGGGWMLRGQSECFVEAATLDGYGKADILKKIPKSPAIVPNVVGNTVTPTTPLWPFPAAGRWRINGEWRDSFTGEGTVTIELRGGVGQHGQVDGLLVAEANVTLPPVTPIPEPEPTLTSIAFLRSSGALFPDAIQMTEGELLTYTVYGRYSDGAERFVPASTSSSNVRSVVVNGSQIIAMRRGQATVKAWFEGYSDSIAVSVKRRRWW